MKMRWLVAVSIVAVLAPAALSAAPLQEPAAHFSGVSAEREFRMEVQGAAGADASEVVVQLEMGRASWDLIDPSGEVRVSGEAEAGVVRTLAELPELGTWTVRLKLENATGAYDVRWLADGKPRLPLLPAIRFGVAPHAGSRCTT